MARTIDAANKALETEAADATNPAVAASFQSVQQKIETALNLDFDVRLRDGSGRPARNGAGHIVVHKRKQADTKMRSCALFLAELWGYGDESLTWEQRQRIANAACRQVAYDHGYPKSTGGTSLWMWRKRAKLLLESGSSDPISRTANPRISYTDKIEKDHPGYLHELYRYARRTKGVRASFAEIAECMNAKSGTLEAERPTLSLHKLQVYRWFKANGGSEASANGGNDLIESGRGKKAREEAEMLGGDVPGPAAEQPHPFPVDNADEAAEEDTGEDDAGVEAFI